MRKTYILLLALVISVSGIAQGLNLEEKQSALQFDEIKTFCQLSIFSSNSSSTAPLWEEDFSDGFPQGWSTHTSNTQGGSATCNWVWSTDGSWGYWQGSNGASAGTALESTTAANGFLISDTDSANHHANGQPSGSTYDYIESSFTTSAIDLSSYPAVTLEFEQYLRFNNLTNASFIAPTVSVSSDSISWTDFTVYGDATDNTASENAESVSVNITAVAAAQSTVYLRFRWTSRCYFWMLDDIRIIETPDNELGFNSPAFGGWHIGYSSTIGAGSDYTFYPLIQATAQPYRLEGVVQNTGAQTQNNVTMHVDVEENGNITPLSSTQIPLLSSQNDTLTCLFSPTSTGPHNFNFSASSDSIITTDTTGRGTVVTDTVYGIDYDWASDGANASGYAYLARPDCGQVLGNTFDIFADDDLTSISFHVSEESIVGAEVKVQVYEDIEGSDPLLDEQSASFYKLTLQDIGSWVTLPLSASLFAGKSYVAAVKGSQHPTDTVGISTSSNDYFSGYTQDNGCDIGTQGFGFWYSASSAKLIRMNFGSASWTITTPISGIKDLKYSQFNMYPNPTNGIFTIELDGNSKYDVTVSNILGQPVYTALTTDIKTTIDLSAFKKGVYTVELRNNISNYTEKIIVE